MAKTKRRKSLQFSRIPYLTGVAFLVIFSTFHLANLTRILAEKIQEQRPPKEEVIVQELPKYDYNSCHNEKTIAKKAFDKTLVPEQIKIEKVDIDLAVKSVPLTNGTWKVYQNIANYAEGTSLISGKEGNVGIYAHDRIKGFANIKKLAVGDIIEVFSSGHLIKYRVQSASIANPKDVDVFYPTDNPTLTLITCEGNLSQQRYVVKADLVQIDELDCK